MNDWKFIPTIMLATVLIFGAGVFTGGMLVDYVKQPHGKAVRKNSTASAGSNAVAVVAANSVSNSPAVKPAKVPEFLSKEFLQRLDTDLQLTKDQHEAIRKIIDDGQNAVRKAVQDARLEIREALTPDQRKAFDELVKRPFRRPLFETNAPTFQERLERIIQQSRTNANLPVPVAPRVPRYAPPSAGSSLTPEQQVIALESERAKAMNSNNPPSPILPPTPLMPPQ